MAHYVNEQVVESSSRRGGKDEETRYKCISLSSIVALSFGLLCVLQITLNISLRLAAKSGQERDCPAINNTREEPKHPNKANKDLETSCLLHQNKLQERFNFLTRERDILEDTLSQLKAENQALRRRAFFPPPVQSSLPPSPLYPALFGHQSCPTGWKMVISRCYYVSTEEKTWEESRQDCRGRGADLVVINSRKEQSSLHRLDADQWLVTWIGLARGPENEDWRWVDTTPLAMWFWQVDQTDSGGPISVESCVEMYHKQPVFASWNVAPCGSLRRWMCEREALISPPA